MLGTKHVISFALAQELKEAGYPQWASEFYWVVVHDERYTGETRNAGCYHKDELASMFYCVTPLGEHDKHYETQVAAPLATELLNIIPPRMLFQRDTRRTRVQYKMRAEPKRSDEKLWDKLYREGWRIGWLSIDAVSESGKVDGWSPQYGADYQTFFEIDESLEIVSEDLATLPDALAKLWLHLRKKDLIE